MRALVPLALLAAAACTSATEPAVVPTSTKAATTTVTSPAVTVVVTASTGNVARTLPASTPATPSAPQSTAGAASGLPEGGWRAVSVTDGDTLEVQGAAGRATVRLVGINAPERRECFADQATAALEALVRDRLLVLVLDVSPTDRYGRWLRYVETADGTDVGAALVAGGYAVARRYPPDLARADTYERLEAEARARGLGQWAADACGAPPTGAVVGIEVQADAPGDDNVNLNGEWVRFTNRGAGPLDLEGWVVADTSASHRYTFHGLVLAPGSSVTLFTGCGTDTASSRYWCNHGSAVWNNGGDTVYLRDPAGTTVAYLTY